jgi:hypothetical protein
MIKASISKELLQQKRQWCDRWKLTHQLPNLSKPISSPMHVQHHKTLKASFTSCISITPRKQEWQEWISLHRKSSKNYYQFSSAKASVGWSFKADIESYKLTICFRSPWTLHLTNYVFCWPLTGEDAFPFSFSPRTLTGLLSPSSHWCGRMCAVSRIMGTCQHKLSQEEIDLWTTTRLYPHCFCTHINKATYRE